jgi:glycerol-3-phosphate cytidylyltransferase
MEVIKNIMKNKVVITYGTFDLLHIGHINLLRRAEALGDYLIVGLSTEKFNAIKRKKAVYSFEERKKMLESLKYVDLVIPENTWEQKEEDIIKYGASVFVMGDDWKGKFNNLNKFCEVIYLPYTKEVSTTKIKGKIEKWIKSLKN